MAAVWGSSPRFKHNYRLLACLRHKSEGNIYGVKLNRHLEENPEAWIINEIAFVSPQTDISSGTVGHSTVSTQITFHTGFPLLRRPMHKNTVTHDWFYGFLHTHTPTHTRSPFPRPPPAAPENAPSMMSPAIPAVQRQQKGSPP